MKQWLKKSKNRPGLDTVYYYYRSLLVNVLPWNLNTGKNKMQEDSFINVYLNQHGFDEKRGSVNKEQKYFLLPDHRFAENMVLVFGF